MPPTQKPTTASGAEPQTVEQYVYPGVTEDERPGLIADLWRSGAISVSVVKNPDDTYTVTAIVPV